MVHSRERLMRSINGSRNWMSFISVWSEANERFLKRDAAIGNQRRLRCGITMSGALGGIRQELRGRVLGLTSVMRSVLLQRRARLEALTGQIDALSPLAILDRGYALVFDSSGRLLKDGQQVSAGDDIRARLAKGEITATVKTRA